MQPSTTLVQKSLTVEKHFGYALRTLESRTPASMAGLNAQGFMVTYAKLRVAVVRLFHVHKASLGGHIGVFHPHDVVVSGRVSPDENINTGSDACAAVAQDQNRQTASDSEPQELELL